MVLVVRKLEGWMREKLARRMVAVDRVGRGLVKIREWWRVVAVVQGA